MSIESWGRDKPPEIAGHQFGFQFTKRGGDKDPHVLVHLFTEDDEYWSQVTTFSSYWIDDLLEVVQEAKIALAHHKERFEKDPSGYGVQFRPSVQER